jgi:hypothetical protein
MMATDDVLILWYPYKGCVMSCVRGILWKSGVHGRVLLGDDARSCNASSSAPGRGTSDMWPRMFAWIKSSKLVMNWYRRRERRM